MVAVPSVVERVREVCPLSATTQRVIALTSDPQISFQDIAEALAVDAALAAEVLRLANSAAYGRMGRVQSLEAAVATIGMRELRDMASAMAMLAAFGSTEDLSADLHTLSLLTGAIARKVTRVPDLVEVPVDRGTAFLAGLLAEIGAMACVAVDGTDFIALWSEHIDNDAARQEAELARYGLTSFAVGGSLLRANQLPESLAQAVESCGEATPEDPLGRVACFSRQAAMAMLRFMRVGADEVLDETLEPIARRHQLTVPAAQLTELCKEAAALAYGVMWKTIHGIPIDPRALRDSDPVLQIHDAQTADA